MIEKSRMEELNKYMVSEQNPADYYKNQINWENGFIVGSYWATYNTYKGSERYTYNDKSGGWKFHIHADIDEQTKEEFVQMLNEEMSSKGKNGMGLTPAQIQAVKQRNPDLFTKETQSNLIQQKILADRLAQVKS